MGGDKTGWRRMAEIAEKSMAENGYTIEEVREYLKELRREYVRKTTHEICDRNDEALKRLEEMRRSE